MRPGRRTVVWFFVLLAALLGQLPGANHAMAWAVRETLVPEKTSMLRNPGFDILVVRIVAVADAGATNADPPRVTVAVEKTLRGRSRDGKKIIARWQAPVTHRDIEPGGGGVTEAWKTAPLAGPRIGDRLIVFGGGGANSLRIQANAVYRATKANERAIRDNAFQAHGATLALALVGGILFLSIAGLILFRMSSTATDRQARKHLRRAVLAAAAAALGLFVYYESGVSPFAAIRIDLLVIVPVLGGVLLLATIALFRRNV
jgi:hypothetical protein